MRTNFKGIKRKFLTGIAAVVAGLLLLLVSPATSAFAEQLRVGVPKVAHAALIYLADSQGFFKKRGLDVILKEYETGILAVEDLIADKVEIATASDFAFVVQSFRHPDLRMPVTICVASDNDLVVRKDRGIRGPQDLKGKRVAVVRGGQTEFFLYSYFIFNRIPEEKVKVVHYNPLAMIEALVGGKIDAALCWAPHTIEMERRLGAKAARWHAQSGQDYYQVLFAKEGFLKKQPKTMEQFLAALFEAEGFIGKYPDRAQAILMNRLKVDRQTLLSTWSRFRFHLQLSQDMIVLMEREAKWAIRNNLLGKKEVPNFLDFLYFDALEKVKPEGVSIVH
ncbi:MAG: NrtA/SsuA/CpmA family ABC transporter substrate-binding protein [Deltaproteobacteria bacterium]|nr:NrtA/SsuA/CpmA family ABC transporter substrate-binding protein [Deltaproteobacteria bacterium]